MGLVACKGRSHVGASWAQVPFCKFLGSRGYEVLEFFYTEMLIFHWTMRAVIGSSLESNNGLGDVLKPLACTSGSFSAKRRGDIYLYFYDP